LQASVTTITSLLIRGASGRPHFGCLAIQLSCRDVRAAGQNILRGVDMQITDLETVQAAESGNVLF
jgi:hypothetical protein